MAKQTIISISREYGTGGHVIAEKIARDFGLKLYDRSLLDEIADEKNMDAGVLEKFDERPRNKILSRRVGAHSNSMEEILAEMQFDFIRKKADSGESFVIVGRCAETVLKGRPELVSIFVTGNADCKLARIMEKYKLNESDAASKIRRHDRKRKQYHNRHSEFNWGDSRHYDLCINSSCLGLEKTAAVLETYIKERM